MMKRSMIPLLMLLAACTGAPVPTPETGCLQVNLADPDTRSAATDAEKRIGQAQFLLFDAEGMLCFYQQTFFPQTESAYRVDLRVPTGEKTLCVVANLERSLQDTPDLNALEATHFLLNENALVSGRGEGLVMAGRLGRIDIRKGQTASCQVFLSRLVARVRVGSVTNGLPEGVRIEAPVLQLSNVAADRNLAGSEPPSLWCNKLLRAGSDVPGQAPVEGPAIACGETWACDACLYAFPNPTGSDAYGGSFTPRKTRLVLSCRIDGLPCYYPVTLESLAENTSYQVDLTLRRPGSEDPDRPVESGAFRFHIVPEAWQTPVSYPETL